MKSIHLSALFASGVTALFAAGSLRAQPVTTNTQINLVVGFAPGGSADSIARIVGNRLGEKTGRRVVIENKPGAGGNISAKSVIGAAADGATLLVTTAALPINETLYRNKGFSVEQLRTVAIVATTPEVFAVNPATPAKTLPEFVELFKGKQISFGTAGVGTGSHIAGEYFFKEIAKGDAKHVPFRGGPDATNALMGGHLSMVISSLSGFASQIAGEQLRGLAVASAARIQVISKVPTFGEAGYAGFTSFSWVGFFAPGATPAAELARLNKEIDEIVREPAIRERLVAIGFDPMNATLPEADAFMKREVEQWRKMVRALDLSVD